jgi:hypothetical protein
MGYVVFVLPIFCGTTGLYRISLFGTVLPVTYQQIDLSHTTYSPSPFQNQSADYSQSHSDNQLAFTQISTLIYGICQPV